MISTSAKSAKTSLTIWNAMARMVFVVIASAAASVAASAKPSALPLAAEVVLPPVKRETSATVNATSLLTALQLTKNHL